MKKLLILASMLSLLLGAISVNAQETEKKTDIKAESGKKAESGAVNMNDAKGIAAPVESPSAAKPGDAKPGNEKLKIGVYDSRAVAVASSGSEYDGKDVKVLYDEMEKAKAAKDEKKIKEIKEKGKKRQQLRHTQAFSTAPIDDIMALIKDKLPEISKKEGLTALVSKWDTETLAKYPDAEQVDVTNALIDAFNPNEKQRKSAIEIQKAKPISIKEAESIDD